MKVLIIGGGGREHALAWKIHANEEIHSIHAIPGNAGIAKIATCVPMEVNNISGLAEFAEEKGIDLTIVGPELPLSLGIVNEFQKRGLVVFGPTQEATQIESSKAFAKQLMEKNHIPTPNYRNFSNPLEAKDYINKINRPCVIKADGLAAGKGVFVCHEIEEAFRAIEVIMEKNTFGQAGQTIIIEDLLTGEEASFLAFTDGETIVPLSSAQDHKPIYDDDQGPNTGGMGAYSPAPIVSEEIHEKIMNKIMVPTIEGLARLGINYRGVLYAGVMIQNNEPMVLEFNARFGDPETQPLLMRLESDLVDIIQKTIQQQLHQVKIKWHNKASTCVVLAAEGYPGPYSKGETISGLEQFAQIPEIEVFHAGTAQKEDKIITAGGRVLGVTALGNSIEDSISRAYEAIEKIHFKGMYYRKDIGRRALLREKT